MQAKSFFLGMATAAALITIGLVLGFVVGKQNSRGGQDLLAPKPFSAKTVQEEPVLVPAPKTTPETPRVTAQGQENPEAWIYFTSKENKEGSPPELSLTINGKTVSVPVAEDSLLISYLASGSYGNHTELSISLNDSNRVLLGFNLPPNVRATDLQKAELILNLRLSGIPPKNPFDIAVHQVLQPWSETTTTWRNQPKFDPAKIAVFKAGLEQGLMRVDVTAAVQKWLGGKPNYGLLLHVANPLGEPPVRD